MSESNTDRFLRARQQFESAQAQKTALARRLQDLATRLNHPGGIRLNEEYVSSGPARSYMTELDESEWPTWDEVATTIRNAVKAEDDFRAVDADLSPTERKLLKLS